MKEIPSIGAVRVSLSHGAALVFLVTRRKRQQSDVASLLDGPGEAALVRGANTGQTPGNDFAAFSHKPLQQAHIAVRDGVDLLGAELADLLAAEELAASAGTACGSGGSRRATATGMAAAWSRAGSRPAFCCLNLNFVGHAVSFSCGVARHLRVAGSG